MTLHHKCEPEAANCYLRGLPDFAMFDDHGNASNNSCFAPSKVRLGDIDGMGYQNGKLLGLEKKYPRGALEGPQLKIINEITRPCPSCGHNNGNAYIAFWCERSDGQDMQEMRVFNIDGYDPNKIVKASQEDVRNAVKAWWGTAFDPNFPYDKPFKPWWAVR